MDDVFSEFSSLIHTRLSTSIHTTEDSIRYTFFVALLNHTNLKPHDIVLEYPHPTISGESDTFIPSLNGQPVVIEFKYDRDIPSGSSVPKTQNAGELFADIYRLSKFTALPEPERFLVYCTDQIMAQYFRKPANRYSGFFDLACGHTMLIDQKFPDSRLAA
jgi:hypothetical protein